MQPSSRGCKITANSWNFDLNINSWNCDLYINDVKVVVPQSMSFRSISGAYITQVTRNKIDGSCNATTLTTGPQPSGGNSISNENIIRSVNTNTLAPGSIGVFSVCDNVNGISAEAITALQTTFRTSTTAFANWRQSNIAITEIGGSDPPLCEKVSKDVLSRTVHLDSPTSAPVHGDGFL